MVLLLPKGSDKGVAGGKAKKEDIIFAARVAAFYSKARYLYVYFQSHFANSAARCVLW